MQRRITSAGEQGKLPKRLLSLFHAIICYTPDLGFWLTPLHLVIEWFCGDEALPPRGRPTVEDLPITLYLQLRLWAAGE